MKPNSKKYNYKNSNWKLKRLEVFKRDNNMCTKCKSNKNLQCHHTYYIPGRMLHEYPLQSFLTLCSKCHTDLHKTIKGAKLVIRNKQDILNKIKEEKENGFLLLKKNIDKPIISKVIKTEGKKPKFKKSNNDIQREKNLPKKIKELQERRNRIVVPHWKIDEYRKK